MTPFLLAWSIFCGALVGSFVYYLTNVEMDPEKANLFWKIGRGYDKFFFNHGEPTAVREPEKDE